MIALSVNLNKIALIRNSRDTRIPDIPSHAQICIDAGMNDYLSKPVNADKIKTMLDKWLPPVETVN